MPRNPRPRRGRDDRHVRRRAARAVRAAASHEGAVERQGGGVDLPWDARARRRRSRGPPRRLPRSRRAHGDRRRGRVALVREAAPRHGRHAEAAACGRRATSSTSARSTTTGASRARRRRRAGRGDRRRLHRLGDRRSARHERMRRHDRLPGCRDRRAPLPGGALRLRERLLPREGRHRPRGGARRDDLLRHGDDEAAEPTIEADAIVAGLGIVPATDLAEAAGLEVDDGILVDELRARRRARRRVRGRRRRSLPGARARRDEARRARGSREHARTCGRRQHGRRRAAVRPPPVLLLRPVRPRLRGCRRRRLDVSTPSRSGPSRTARASSPTSTATARRADSCSGTPGARSTPRAS